MTWVDFQCNTTATDGSVEAEIRVLWREYLVDILGIPPVHAEKRIEAEVMCQLHVGLLDGLTSRGWLFSGATVLDLGCGTGALANQLAARGAQVIGLEPSPVWATAAGRRLRERGDTHGAVIIADGARVPLADHSVDYAISLQVLEHVPMPVAKQVIREMARVLRPGGRVYLSFENYWSFWEPHYRVRWFPLLPKPIGSLYLRLLGRNPQFLCDHIYYNSFIGLALACHEAGLTKPYWTALIGKLEDPELVLGKIQRRVAHILHGVPPAVRTMLAIAQAERYQLMQSTVHLELMND